MLNYENIFRPIVVVNMILYMGTYDVWWIGEFIRPFKKTLNVKNDAISILEIQDQHTYSENDTRKHREISQNLRKIKYYGYWIRIEIRIIPII